jgi:hypothetical protein
VQIIVHFNDSGAWTATFDGQTGVVVEPLPRGQASAWEEFVAAYMGMIPAGAK